MLSSSTVILFLLFAAVIARTASSPLEYEPYSLLKQDRLVGFFPLEPDDLFNAAPFGDAQYER